MDTNEKITEPVYLETPSPRPSASTPPYPNAPSTWTDPEKPANKLCRACGALVGHQYTNPVFERSGRLLVGGKWWPSGCPPCLKQELKRAQENLAEGARLEAAAAEERRWRDVGLLELHR